jgi:hypothetical protein
MCCQDGSDIAGPVSFSYAAKPPPPATLKYPSINAFLNRTSGFDVLKQAIKMANLTDYFGNPFRRLTCFFPNDTVGGGLDRFDQGSLFLAAFLLHARYLPSNIHSFCAAPASSCCTASLGLDAAMANTSSSQPAACPSPHGGLPNLCLQAWQDLVAGTPVNLTQLLADTPSLTNDLLYHCHHNDLTLAKLPRGNLLMLNNQNVTIIRSVLAAISCHFASIGVGRQKHEQHP